MTDFRLAPPWSRRLQEFALLFAMALFMGVVGAFGADALPFFARYLYFFLCVVGGGTIGFAIDDWVAPRVKSLWLRVPLASLLMMPPVTLLVLGAGWLVAGAPVTLHRVSILWWENYLVSLPIIAIRAMIWRPPETIVETRTIVVPPLPDADATFRQRLSAKRRTARLLALEAEDHYVRVHTDAGIELVTVRFADALAELAQAHGYQTHRSWWVAADAIENARWRRGAGDLRLVGDLVVPVSRTYAPALKEAGWH
jgi:LytTr DNA-binding domain